MTKKGRPPGQASKVEVRGPPEMIEKMDKERGHEPRASHARRLIDMTGYIAINDPEKDFPVVYTPHLPRGGLLRFLKDLKNSSALHDHRLSKEVEDWEHIGYNNRPIPSGSWPMRGVNRDNLIVRDGGVHERILSHPHSHALLPVDLEVEEIRRGVAFVDRETFFRYGHAQNLRGYVLEPLTEKLYLREYRGGFAIGTLLKFEDSRVWRLESVEPNVAGQMVFTCRLLDPSEISIN